MFTDGATENEKKFTFDVTFGWGEKFKGCNPGKYLDGEIPDHSPDEIFAGASTLEEIVDIKMKVKLLYEKMKDLLKDREKTLFVDESGNVDAANLKFVVTVEAVSK